MLNVFVCSLKINVSGNKYVQSLQLVSGGRQSVQWASQGEDALRTAVLDSLSTLFGGTWVREPCDFVLKNWNEDPFAGGGSVAAPIPGKMHAFHALREPGVATVNSFHLKL